MGTIVEITLIGDDEESAREAALQGFHEIKRIEQLMSPRIDSSDVSKINRSAGKEWVKVSKETIEVVLKAREISEFSEGAFDITIGPLSHLWRIAREKRELPPSAEMRKGLALIDFKAISADSEGRVFLKKTEMAIDLGGIAKGYTVDQAFELLRSLGYSNLIVNAGGDLRVGGLRFGQPWIIGIQDPRASEKPMTRVEVTEAAIATSGDYERFFLYRGKRYHHIINPKDSLPAETCQSATIIGKDAMTVDALTTAVFVLGGEKGYALCRRIGVDCLIVDKKGKVMVSPGLNRRIKHATSVMVQ